MSQKALLRQEKHTLLIDSVIYAGEFDLLQLRMCELESIVDRFIVVEGNLTFTGHPREIDKRLDSIPHLTHVVVDNFPEASERNPWKREAWQRNAILWGLLGESEFATVMVSDVDEIPNHHTIPQSIPQGEIAVCFQDWMQFTFSTKVTGANACWHGTRICRLDTLRRVYPQGVRNQHTSVIQDGGWHLSWQGGGEAIARKIAAYSHQELNSMAGTIPERVAERWGQTYEFVAGTAHLPECVRQNPEQWEKYFVYESVHAH